MLRAKFENRKRSLVFCISVFCFCFSACSIPNLEAGECTMARDVLKRYYSLAIGGDLANTPGLRDELVALRTENFIVSNLSESSGGDPFFFSKISPSSFRINKCSLSDDYRTYLDVTVIWQLDNQIYQRTDSVTLANDEPGWRIEHIRVGEQPGPNF